MNEGRSTNEATAQADATLSVVIAARNAGAHLAHALPPLAAMQRRGEIAEIILVDDASEDDTADVAAAHDGVRLFPLAEQRGPAHARNVGAEAAHGEWLWFVDADVVVHDDAARILSATCADETVDAVFGSYGTAPTEPNFLSQYKNLVHHYVHQQGAGPAETFWTGCGAVRASAFTAIGGFDAERFQGIGMEDIDLGLRLRGAGHAIRLEPTLRCEHRKRWTFWPLLKVEIGQRALPWSRLILARQDSAPASLNVGRAEQLRALIAGLGVLLLMLACLPGWPVAIAALVPPLWLAANWRLFCFFRDERGAGFALRALLFHQLYYLYSAATFVYAWIEHRFGWRRTEAIIGE